MTSPEPGRAAGVTSADPLGLGPATTPRAEAVIDLDAISGNVARLREHVGGRDLMAVVKADAYGHGIIPSAQAARAGGAGWLGVALLDEALTLRAAGDTGRILSWLAVPGEQYAVGIAAGVDMSAYTADQLHVLGDTARQLGQRARLQLKLDSGLGRGGAQPHDWPLLVEAALQRQRAGDVEITGIWSHFACSDEPSHPSNRAQLDVFNAGLGFASDAGLDVEHIHLANSGAALAIPESWFTMIRPGIAVYGVSPFADGTAPVELAPAMTLRATLALAKRVQAGHGVSYGHTYATASETTLGLVPIGYGDGIPRHASGRGPALIGGQVFTVAGRVCMDQFVLDLGDLQVAAGDPVVLFGDSREGEPTVHDWATASDTIGYEIVTRIGSRVPRRYVGGGG